MNRPVASDQGAVTRRRNYPLGAYFEREAERFTALAKDAALAAMRAPESPEHRRRAEDHLVRAATYRDAARIAAGHGGGAR